MVVGTHISVPQNPVKMAKHVIINDISTDDQSSITDTQEIYYYKEESIDKTSTTDKLLVPDNQKIAFHMEAPRYEIPTALYLQVS